MRLIFAILLFLSGAWAVSGVQIVGIKQMASGRVVVLNVLGADPSALNVSFNNDAVKCTSSAAGVGLDKIVRKWVYECPISTASGRFEVRYLDERSKEQIMGRFIE